MAYSYDDFLKATQAAGLEGQFSQYDMDMAKQHPEFGLSILSLKKDYQGATTDEQRLLINQAANELRSSYGNYSGGPDGSQFISGGKLPGQVDTMLDKINDYGAFSFDTEAPTYTDPYAEKRQELLDAVLNRGEFTWSKETDPQWAPYKKQYLREGERATADALGQASAASGGRPSSYAVGAATQAGDYYATKLNDIIPTLYQQAYDRYLKEYQMKLQDLGALNTQEQMEYQKYLDQLGQFNTDRQFAYGQYLDGFTQLQDKLSALQGQEGIDYGRALDNATMTMQRQQNERDNAVSQVAAILQSGGMPSDELLKVAGLTGEYAQGVHAGWQRDQDQQSQALLQAQVDAMLAAGGKPSEAMIQGAGYQGEYVQALLNAFQREQAAKTKAASSPTQKTGEVPTPQTDPLTAFSSGDHSDATIKALVDMGYTEGQIKAAGYTGKYFDGSAAGGYSMDDLSVGAVHALGIGPISYDEVERLVEEGKVGVRTDAKGKLAVEWINGWSTEKYLKEGAGQRLPESVKGSGILSPAQGLMAGLSKR